jgi:hypothetical protein
MSEQTPNERIDDPDDFTTSKRLSHIFDARRQLREIRREASIMRNRSGRSAKFQAIQYYRSGVESYLLEVDTLLRRHSPGPYLWREKKYGTLTFNPPGKFREQMGSYVAENIQMKPNVPLRVKSIPEPKTMDIIGLKWLFEVESPARAVFEFEVDNASMGSTHTDTARACISWTALNEMVSDVNYFLGELGIGLDAADNNEPWRFVEFDDDSGGMRGLENGN